MNITASRLFLVIAVVLLLLATLAAATVIVGDLAWALPGGLTSLALSFLVP